MSHDQNSETLDTLKTEIKALQESCVNTCHIIENAPPEFSSDRVVDGEEVKHKITKYVNGLEAAVQNTNTCITTDINLLTTQFLNEMKEKTVQVDELSAYTAGAIRDLDREINRLKNQISVAQEAQSKPCKKRQVVQPEHMAKAKGRFRMMKNEVHGLIQSLFPQDHEEVRSVLGELMAAKLDDTAEDYVTITRENFDVIQILKDMNIVTVNPYNQLEVKLNYY